MMGSTLMGMVIGIAIAAWLTTHYADVWNDWAHALRPADPATALDSGDRPDRRVVEGRNTEEMAASLPAPERAPAGVVALRDPEPTAQAKTSPPEAEPDSGDVIEQAWAAFAAQADEARPAGDFRWRECFTRAAAAHEVSEALLLAIASGESGFDPAARSDKDAIGLMQIRWPGTSRHLGVLREADLYDPCTNVDAGARYLSELGERFDRNLHRVVAAYNYGPGRIDGAAMPQGARWYSQYIYQHLQQVLGKAHVPTSELIPPTADSAGGFEVLFRFNQPYRARDFVSFVETRVPGLQLAHRSEALGQHEVVLLYSDESQRLRALDSLRDAGLVVTGHPSATPNTF